MTRTSMNTEQATVLPPGRATASTRRRRAIQRRALRAQRHAAGLTLVEILVTLLVMSIGLLGVAALHSTSLRNNYDALMRSHASALAADIADRMRANRNEVIENWGTSRYNVAFGEARTPDGSSLPDQDIADWKATLDEQLPDGDGQIAIDGGTRTVTIVIQWGERDQIMTFTTQTEV